MEKDPSLSQMEVCLFFVKISQLASVFCVCKDLFMCCIILRMNLMSYLFFNLMSCLFLDLISCMFAYLVMHNLFSIDRLLKRFSNRNLEVKSSALEEE